MALRLSRLPRLAAFTRLPLTGRVVGARSSSVAHISASKNMQDSFRIVRVPTMKDGQKAPQSLMEMSDEKLFMLAEQEDNAACKERLHRNVMAVDNVDYSAAAEKMKEIEAASFGNMGLVTLPYKIGITSGLVIGVGSVPMVFDYNLATWFNAFYVCETVPEPEDLQTVYEVGAWTWGWMEPLIGTGSFVILAMQVARNQMMNLGIKPYTGWVKTRRSTNLAAQFPQYNVAFVKDYARTASMKKAKPSAFGH